MENPIEMDDLGVPLFFETPISLYLSADGRLSAINSSSNSSVEKSPCCFDLQQQENKHHILTSRQKKQPKASVDLTYEHVWVGLRSWGWQWCKMSDKKTCHAKIKETEYSTFCRCCIASLTFAIASTWTTWKTCRKTHLPETWSTRVMCETTSLAIQSLEIQLAHLRRFRTMRRFLGPALLQTRQREKLWPKRRGAEIYRWILNGCHGDLIVTWKSSTLFPSDFNDIYSYNYSVLYVFILITMYFIFIPYKYILDIYRNIYLYIYIIS